VPKQAMMTGVGSRAFADENQIIYHIDGVPTTHTGAIKSKI